MQRKAVARDSRAERAHLKHKSITLSFQKEVSRIIIKKIITRTPRKE